MREKIKNISEQFDNDLKKTNDIDELFLKYFSKKHGEITTLMKDLASLSVDEKKEFGPVLNRLQNDFKQRIEEKRSKIDTSAGFDSETDLTCPETPYNSGYLHPTTQVIRQMNEFFRYYGFSVVEGPEIETAEFNFRKLNLPEGHPATDLQDTLFVNEPNILLRTHTSSVEARILTDQKPPIRAVVFGKCYRNETYNATNAAFFHQCQGIVVDRGITIKNLMHTLEEFHKFLFGEDTEVRFRYKYYPEVSPGVGVDMKCKFCSGEGCGVCKQRGWIEVLGSGMIHYNTLKMCGIDPEEYTGFAFGMGLDRLVMQKFAITDIRSLYGGGLVYA